jgi:hypothetical protein
MRPEHPDCPCPVCAQFRHSQDVDGVLLVGVAVAVVLVGLVWLVGQVAGLLAGGGWPQVPLAELPGILIRLPRQLADPARAWPAAVRERLPGPAGMYATLALLLAIPVLLGMLAGLVAPPTQHRTLANHAPPRPPAPRPRRVLGSAAVTATSPARPAGLVSVAGDAQGRAATNPVAALPCATPHRLLIPPRGTLAYPSPKARLSLARGGEPSRSVTVARAVRRACVFAVVRRPAATPRPGASVVTVVPPTGMPQTS